jgi:hypothetical protein
MMHLLLAQAAEATASPAAAIAAGAAGVSAVAGPSTLTKLGVGLLLGAAGQGARSIVGLKKTSDEAKAAETSFASQFDGSQLVVSLLIGAIAGLFGALAIWQKMSNLDNRETLLALVAAGYAGADFTEGFMRNQALPPATPKTNATKVQTLQQGLGD